MFLLCGVWVEFYLKMRILDKSSSVSANDWGKEVERFMSILGKQKSTTISCRWAPLQARQVNTYSLHPSQAEIGAKEGSCSIECSIICLLPAAQLDCQQSATLTIFSYSWWECVRRGNLSVSSYWYHAGLPALLTLLYPRRCRYPQPALVCRAGKRCLIWCQVDSRDMYGCAAWLATSIISLHSLCRLSIVRASYSNDQSWCSLAAARMVAFSVSVQFGWRIGNIPDIFQELDKFFLVVIQLATVCGH